MISCYAVAMIYDVIVIGSGYAGLAAAIEARQAGASVIVLEKMRAAGGNSIISDGGMAVAGSALQRRHGIEDSAELFYRDMMKAGLGLNYPELVKIVTGHSQEAYSWLTEELGVEFMDRVDLFGGHSVARSHGAVRITGASIIKPMLKRLEELEIPIHYGWHVTGLLFDHQRVTGVEAESGYSFKTKRGDQRQVIHARNGVILAGGGFGADVRFRAAHDPRLNRDIDTTNKVCATSELLVEAMKKGASAIQLSHIQLGPWASPDEKGFGSGPLFADYIGLIYGILVAPDTGSRFINEHSDRKVLSDAILATGAPCICISDDAAVKQSGWDIGRALQKEVVRTFDDLPSLAEFYHVPADSLSSTVDRFNTSISDHDSSLYGRSIMADSLPIQSPPYYAMRVWPKVHYTMGGLQIDSKARVISLDQEPMEGLYAAGEMTGGIHGACRLGSCAVTNCIVFGRIAGAQAAGGGN